MVIVKFFEGLSEGEDEAPSKKAPKRDSLPPFVYSPKERLFNLTPPFKPVNMKEVYLPHSTVPRNAMTVRSHWNSGSEQFINYMNKQFIPFQAQHTNDSNPIIYVKRGTTGIAGQMRGVCDVLLLSIIHQRPFKMYASSLQSYLFAFPIANVTYPVTLANDSGAPAPLPSPLDNEHIVQNYNKKNHPRVDTWIEFTINNATPGVNAPGDFNTLYPGSTAVISLHSFLRPLLANRANHNRVARLFGMSVNQRPQGVWYRTCMQSLFQPTEYLRGYLQPYLKLFARHPVLGIHIRSGDSTKWKDASFHLTPDVITREFDHIDAVLRNLTAPLIFLSSDSDTYKQLILDRYGKIVFTVSGLDLKHVGKSSTQSGLLRAAMELHLIGQCDYLLLTPVSGFGDCGKRLNRKKPTVWYFQPLPSPSPSVK